jgi:hypothetical protein
MDVTMKILVWGLIGAAALTAFVLAGMIVMSGDASFLYNWQH